MNKKAPYIYCGKSKENRHLWGSVAKNPKRVWFYLAVKMGYPISGSYIFRLKKQGFKVVKYYMLEAKDQGDIC